MAQKRKVVVVMSQNVQDEDQVSQILDQTAQSLQKLAKNLAESSQSQPRKLRSRKKKEDLEVIDEVEAKKPKLEESGKEKEKEETEDSCPICYDKPLHPVTLPCGHVYCFLCGKGLVWLSPEPVNVPCVAVLFLEIFSSTRIQVWKLKKKDKTFSGTIKVVMVGGSLTRGTIKTLKTLFKTKKKKFTF